MVVVSADARTSKLFSVSRSRAPDNKIPLLRPSAIRGSVSGTFSGPILVVLRGTGYYRLLSSPQTFTFESVPSGAYTLQLFVLSTGGEKRIVKEGTSKTIDVLPGAAYDTGVVLVD